MSDIEDINIFEMSIPTAGKLQTFLTVNEDNLYATYIDEESLTDRPLNLRCKTRDEDRYILVRWKADSELSNNVIMHELLELIGEVNDFNHRHQLSG